jgi:hypothetical protein
VPIFIRLITYQKKKKEKRKIATHILSFYLFRNWMLLPDHLFLSNIEARINCGGHNAWNRNDKQDQNLKRFTAECRL